VALPPASCLLSTAITLAIAIAIAFAITTSLLFSIDTGFKFLYFNILKNQTIGKEFSMKRPLILTLLLMLIVSLGPPDSVSQVVTGSVTFDPAELTWQTQDGYDMPRLGDCDLIRQAGAPQLPVCAVQVAIPLHTTVDHIEILSTTSQLLPNQRMIYPAQPPQILSLTQEQKEAIPFVGPKPAIYRSGEVFPSQILEYTGAGNMGEVQLASLLVYPLQYLPEEQKVRFHQRIDFAVHLSVRGKSPVLKRSRTSAVRDPLRKAVSRLALNPGDLSPAAPIPEAHGEMVYLEELAEYVIITDLAFQGAFQVLADWKTKKGVPARVVSTTWIDGEYEGADRQERIRQFILDAYQNWGTIWVLLAADTQLIPHRMAYAMDSQTDYNDLPCDLYYADLDGDWNADGDDTFGELEDVVDLYPEVIVGRAPISTVAQAENFVDKVLAYEKPALLDYQQKALFAAEILWQNPYTDASESKELIDERYLPPQFDPVTKLYESWGNESVYAFIQAVNAGVGIINHDGHAYFSVMGMGTGYLTNSDMDYLHNGGRLGLLYSIGCWPAAFDHDCIAEHFVNNPNGGGVAFIGNSRYGWGSPGNPLYGYSDRFDQQFFKTVFQDGITKAGQALATTKAFYVPRSRQENVYRWHQYQLTLLGDPEMPLWTRTPGHLTVEHPQQIPAETSLVVVSVSDGHHALKDALVCLMGDAGVYGRAATDLYGKASFTICPDSSEFLWTTVTCADFLPYEGHLTVFSSGPHLTLHHVDMQEISGNGDGVVSPQERIGLDINLKNWGNEMAREVTATISWQDDYLAVEDSVISFGDIAPGEIISSGLVCCFTVGAGCPNGHSLRFELELEDQGGHNWSDEIDILVSTPSLSHQSFRLDDGHWGDGDGVPEAGEELDLTITLTNSGGEQARELAVELETQDSYLTVLQPQVALGDLDADSTGEVTFRLLVAPDCPEPRFPLLEISGATSDGYSFQQTLLLTIGQVGFADDLESDSYYWSHWATSPYWKFTTRRAHSGATSWYCGQDGTTPSYLAGMDCSLTTMPVVVGPNTKLSFWHWYDLATYGSDGLYVEISTGEDWEVLDFLGSGGALDSTLIGNDWFQDTYELPHVEPGTFLQVRFRFYSDADTVVAEGVYVDDVSITSAVLSDRAQDPTDTSPSQPFSFRLSQNYPNPFNAVTHLLMSIPAGNMGYRDRLPLMTTVEIYNVSGQKVRSLLRARLNAGEYRLIWDGRDDKGQPVGSGIYFCRVVVESFRQTTKMVLLR